MIVPPVQDLITDVMAAADPASQRIAAIKLERLAASADQDFATTMNETASTNALEQGGGASATTASAPAPAAPAAQADSATHTQFINKPANGKDAYRKFEAFVLQMFVESMLPKDATELFGKGTAGTVWRSMLAEQIGNEMAKGNGIGIAKQLEKSRSAATGLMPEG